MKRADPWHDKLKGKLAGPLKEANFPSLQQICNFCSLSQGDTLIPKCAARVCKSWLVLGRCKYENCKLMHRTARDDQVNSILSKLEHFIAKPDECPKGKGP